MTQEELESQPVDPITQAQTEIDAEQGGTPPVFTGEQVQQMIQAQLAPFQNELRGVQGLPAKALDAHRGEWGGPAGRPRAARPSPGVGRADCQPAKQHGTSGMAQYLRRVRTPSS